MISTEIQTITATVRSVRYPREAVQGRAWRAISTDRGGASGYLPDTPAPGTKIELTGRWMERNGINTFCFTKYKYVLPEGSREELEYAVNHATGLGKATLEKIWNTYGESWRERMNEMPAPLRAKLEEGVRALHALAALPAVLRLLKPHGATDRKCEDICDHFRNTPEFALAPDAFITADPYRLTDIEGIGFRWVDEMALKIGVEPADGRRMRAAVNYVLAERERASGDTVHPRAAVCKALDDLQILPEDYEPAIEAAVKSGDIVSLDPYYIRGKEHRAEADILDYALRTDPTDADEDEVEVPPGFKPDAGQLAAIRRAVGTRGLTIVTGAAGTGKTSIIRAVHASLSNYETVNVCAFAGKAAARVREAGVPASTIHSLLRILPGGKSPRVSLEGQTVIVDEASMVPNWLMARIVAAAPKRLVLVGDVAQLPPVGTGAPFHVLTRKLPALVCRLSKCHRANSAILNQCAAVRDGRGPKDEISKTEAVHVVKVSGADAAKSLILRAVREGKLDFSRDCVLTPRNGEEDGAAVASVADLNAEIGAIANPRPHGVTARLMAGDRVMCVRNHPDVDVWNGTCGWMREGNGGDMLRGLQFENADNGDTIDAKSHSLSPDLKPAWAMTVHKSQGSEYENVIVVALRRDRFLFDNAMLYTAMSRAKRRCFVITDDDLSRVASDRRIRMTWMELKIATAGQEA